MTETEAIRDEGLMTVGELARRTGLSIKAIRQYEAMGLIYSAGRSESNYRLFDDSALWCAEVISTLRSLGLTIKEIDQMARAYFRDPDAPSGPRLAVLLDGAEQRIADRIADLRAVRGAFATTASGTPPRSRAGRWAISWVPTRGGDRRLDSAPGGRPHHRVDPRQGAAT